IQMVHSCRGEQRFIRLQVARTVMSCANSLKSLQSDKENYVDALIVCYAVSNFIPEFFRNSYYISVVLCKLSGLYQLADYSAGN
ncbi:hypothetical protein EAY19_15145, partial [Vibrio anguillarum]|nr:hypothetical protein [Vibrio anguillarum]